ncbi:DUF3168 domain-containing protein [Yinghuangia sp. YIM S09857]|uniref:DUF3168 domain-containing protein n=1 Tax=Yinghuangia sp. YIM S09857 TaxID=3436929 RepID=UPI003F52E08F
MTARSPLAAIQRAVFARLTGDAELMDVVTGVYDYLPEDAPYPFLNLGEAIETPDNRHGGFGRQTVLTLHIWSKYRGYAQARDINDHLIRLLDHQPLILDGFDHIATRHEDTQMITDPEPPGDLRHGITRVRVVTEQP